MHYLIKTAICLMITASMLGCTKDGRLKIYRIDIPQGNIVTDDMVSKLRLGMTYSQVRFILGTPLLIDTFHQTRWDYVYSYQPGSPARPPHLYPEDKRLKLHFVQGNLESFEFRETPGLESAKKETLDSDLPEAPGSDLPPVPSAPGPGGAAGST